MPLLELRRVSLRFGGVLALDEVSLALDEGDLVGLIGPNGAGKSSLLNVISRLVTPQGGSVRLAGEELLRLPAHALAGRGVARTLQHGELFPTLTVLENALAAAQGRGSAARAAAREALELTDLARLAGRRADTLPFGTLRAVSLARALAGRPRLLLLDEPAAGLAPGEVETLEALLGGLAARGLTVLLVEHDMRLVMSLCRRVHVLDFGRTIAEGAPDEVRQHPAVLEAYLGAGVAAARA